jgi:hypothetical protein
MILILTLMVTLNTHAESQVAYQPALVPGSILPAGSQVTVNSQDVQTPMILQILGSIGKWIMSAFVPAKTMTNEKVYLPKDAITAAPFQGEKVIELTKATQSYKEGTRKVEASPSETDASLVLEDATKKNKTAAANARDCDFSPKPGSNSMDWQAYVKKFEEVAAKTEINPKAVAKTAAFLRNANGNQIKQIKNRRYVTISDMTMSSVNKRMAVLDLQTGKVAYYRVSHGIGSGPGDTVASCSNGNGSNQTPPGFHVVNSPYNGKYGDSLKMNGLERRNSASFDRHVVMHARDSEKFSQDVISGLHRISTSEGCPMLTQEDYREVRNEVKGGSLYYNFCPEDR